MPTYEYECKKCGHRFEEFQSITAEPLKTCRKAKCRGRVKRLIGGGGVCCLKDRVFTRPIIVVKVTRKQLKLIPVAALLKRAITKNV